MINIDAQLSWLFKQQRFGIKPGLERVHQLFKDLGHPEKTFQTVLVGGTNGKGSTVATLASILTVSGKRTAHFTSPHLTHFNERFVVNTEPLPYSEILTTLATLRPIAEAHQATFFEIIVALACQLFAQQQVEIAVMEVGLGGKFDATNALDPSLSIITNVSRDHMAILGNSVEAIAADKAGIMRPKRYCLTATEDTALEVLQKQARHTESILWSIKHEIQLASQSSGWQGHQSTIYSPCGKTQVTSPLIGSHQATNVCLAVVAAQLLNCQPDAIEQGVKETRWPGRLETLKAHSRRFLLDGAHNEASAKALVSALEALELSQPLLILGLSEDKEAEVISRLIKPAFGKVILTQAELSPRALPGSTLATFFDDCLVTTSPSEAISEALKISQKDDVIVIAGSLYLVGECRPLLLHEVSERLERWQ